MNNAAENNTQKNNNVTCKEGTDRNAVVSTLRVKAYRHVCCLLVT